MLLGIAAFYLFMAGIMFGWVAIKLKSNGFPPVLGVLFLLIGIYTVYTILKNAAGITVTKDSLTFGKQTYSWEEVAEIRLTGKKPYKYFFAFPMEGASFRLENGSVLYMFDHIYSNPAEIKKFISVNVLNKGESQVERNIPVPATALAGIETFKGNQFTSLRGLVIWVFPLYLLFMWLTGRVSAKNPGWLLPVVATSWFFLWSYFTFYFQIDEGSLIIRNHNYFWVSKKYDLSNIHEITFETTRKWPNCLRVITNDFKTRLYPAGTLRDRDWQNLQKTFEQYGIPVRNEI